MAIIRELITKWTLKAPLDKVKKFQDGVNGAKKRMSAFHRVSDRASKALTQNFKRMAIAVAVFSVAAGKAFLDIDAAIKNTLTLTKAEGKAFEDLETGMVARAIKLSQQLGISADKVADGFYQVLSTGADALSPRFNELAEVALKMAKVVGLEPTQAIESLNDTLNAFQLRATEFNRVANVLFETSQLAATTVPQLTEAMKQAAPVAASAGISLEETAAILASFAEAGIKGSESGMAFRQIISKISAPTGEAKESLKKLKTEVFNTDGTMRNIFPILNDLKLGLVDLTEEEAALAVKTVFGQEALSRFFALMGRNIKTTEKWAVGMAKGEEVLERAFIIKMSAAKEQVGLLWIALKNFGYKVVKKVLPIIKDVGKKVGEWKKVFKDVGVSADSLAGNIEDLVKAFEPLAKIVDVTVRGIAELKYAIDNSLPFLGRFKLLGQDIYKILFTWLNPIKAQIEAFKILLGWLDKYLRKVQGARSAVRSVRTPMPTGLPAPEGEPPTSPVGELPASPMEGLQGPLGLPGAAPTGSINKIGLGGDNVTFNIYGATDPMRVAKQVEMIMDKREGSNNRLLAAQLGVTT